MATIAVTGATGFIGNAVVAGLKHAFPDATLRLLVRNAGRRQLPQRPFEGCQVVDGDLDSPPALERLVEGCDAVVHAAAAVAGNSLAAFDRVNVLGTRHLIDAIDAQAPLGHLVHISSLAAGRPELSWYAASKRAAEDMVVARIRNYSILRPPAVYGPQDPALADFWRWLARGWLIRLGPKDARFSLLHVIDLTAAIVALVRCGPTSSILTVSGDQPRGGWNWAELRAAAARVRQGRIGTIALPAPALRAFAATNLLASRMGTGRAMLTPGKARELLHPHWVCDNRDICRLTDWQPTISLEQALDTLPGWTTR